MLRPRIIPFLLIHKGGLVKTTKFLEPKYVGDPLNAVRIFNEKEVDEIMVADMDATVNGKEPNLDLIAKLATECRMPLCYAGGVRSAEHVERIVSLGVEKVGMSSMAVEHPEIISESARRVGSQSVVVVLDIKKEGNHYTIYTRNGKKNCDMDPVGFAKQVQAFGAGEIVVNSIDRDGTGGGYDIELIKLMHNNVTLPITALGGAGKVGDLIHLIQTFGKIGAAAGSLFVFKGKYRAVLITYPSSNEKEALIMAGEKSSKKEVQEDPRGTY